MSPESHLINLAQGGVGGGPTELMKLCLFDWSVCAVAGRQEPVVNALMSTLESNGPCAVFDGPTFDAATAALVNGTMGHALDYDDTHFDHIGHTSAVIMPAVLAAAQEHLRTEIGHVLESVLIGSEAAVRVGLWLGRDHYQTGFHQTATAGAFGATVAVARLLRFDRGQIKHAIGLAATMASGLKGQFGTMGKPLNAGLAARVGIEAATWAKAGMTSDPAGLQTFGATHHGQANDSAWDDEDPWKIARISHKFYACCHGLHAMLRALEDGVINRDTVAQINVFTHPRWMSVCNQQDPKTGLEAKFSYRHTAAMAISGISAMAISNFDDATTCDPTLVALRQKVTITPDITLSEMQSRVVITSDDGAMETRTHDLNAPLSLAARKAGLRSKATRVVGQAKADALWDAINCGDTIAVFD